MDLCYYILLYFFKLPLPFSLDPGLETVPLGPGFRYPSIILLTGTARVSPFSVPAEEVEEDKGSAYISRQSLCQSFSRSV